MTIARALIASTLKLPITAIARAAQEGRKARAALGGHYRPVSYLYTDTTQRNRMRALLTGAALADAVVRLAFIKQDGELRYMLCVPCPGADSTLAYMTVVDVELSSEAERTVYRRVLLDTIVGVQIDYTIGTAV
jgi:hypothetical protein